MSIKIELNSNISGTDNERVTNIQRISQKSFYKKIMSNIMTGNESRALELFNHLIVNNLNTTSRDQELEWLRPWPCTLLEAAKSMKMTRIISILQENEVHL